MGPTRQPFIYEASTGFLLILAVSFLAPKRSIRGDWRELAHSSAAEQNPQELVRQVIHNELRDDAEDMTHWRFRKTDVKGGVSKTWDVVETKHGEVQRLLAIDGHPLTKQQQLTDEARMQQFLASASEQQQRKQNTSSDFSKEQNLMKLLPNALTYRYAGEEHGLIHLTFTPNPDFRPSTREAEVFHHMAGDFWISKFNMRLEEFSGRITSRVEFGWGLLGHLNEGGTFNVKQAEVAKGHWDIILLDTNITGKALFFHTITVKEKMTEYDYHRVPDDLTLRQAADMLKESDTRHGVLTASRSHSKS
jgi:hypothetical protein